MSHPGILRDLLAVVQQDVGKRGLARNPQGNLLDAHPDDFANACASIARTRSATVGVLTGFYIPTAGRGETDGPLGAIYLLRTLSQIGVRVVLLADPFCHQALLVGQQTSGMPVQPILSLDGPHPLLSSLTHLIALERVGPSHTPASIQAQPGATEQTLRTFLDEVPAGHHGRCHTMRGIDVSDQMAPVAELFEPPTRRVPVTIGIGDGGNEIGMGKIPWPVIRANIPGGALVACRVATDHLIVAGVSNWGAYALAAGVALLRQDRPPEDWFDPRREQDILVAMVERGDLVDGVTGQATATVDGLCFEDYVQPLRRLGQIVRG